MAGGSCQVNGRLAGGNGSTDCEQPVLQIQTTASAAARSPDMTRRRSLPVGASYCQATWAWCRPIARVTAATPARSAIHASNAESAAGSTPAGSAFFLAT